MGSVPTTHCADLLTARENLRCRNVRSNQKKCDKALYYLKTDRGAPCALYPALVRSAVCAASILRCPSLKHDLTKAARSIRAALSVQNHCRARADLWRPHSMSCMPNRSRLGSESCGGCARCLRIKRRKATSERHSAGRGDVRVAESGQVSETWQDRRNDPPPPT